MLLLILATGCIESTLSPASQNNVEASGIWVDPPALSFGILAPGESEVREVTISNTGSTSLTLLSVLQEGMSDFSITAPPMGSVLSPGESVDVEVVFTAESLDATGTVWVLSSDPESPEIPIPLNGMTEQGALLIAPNPLTVGHTNPGGEATNVLSLSNIGHAPVTLSQSLLDRDEFAVLNMPALPVTIPAQEALELDVAFYPDTEGIYEARLWLSADDPVGSHLATLRGTSGDSYQEEDPEPEVEDDCFEPEDGFLEHPQARFLVNDSTTPVITTYVNNGGAYVNDIFLSSPTQIPIATTHHDSVGKVVDLGTFSEGEELVLAIFVRDTGNVYYSGPAARNADGFPHVAMAYLGDCTWRVGFEDLWNGGDQDFDDAVITISGPLQLEQ